MNITNQKHTSARREVKMATVLQQVKTTVQQQNQKLKEKHRREVDFLATFYQEQNRMIHELLKQLADSEQLHEKDAQMDKLRTEREIDLPDRNYTEGVYGEMYEQ